MNSKLRTRKSQTMHFGRVSLANARYFITICTNSRNKILCGEEALSAIVHQLEGQQSDGDFKLHCLVVMPDHIHVLFQLADRLSLGQCIAKFKAKTRQSIGWQTDYFDHRLRDDESEEEYAFYIFMNPYNSDLIELNQHWIGWKRWKISPYKFEELLNRDGTIPRNWVKIATDLELKIGKER